MTTCPNTGRDESFAVAFLRRTGAAHMRHIIYRLSFSESSLQRNTTFGLEFRSEFRELFVSFLVRGEKGILRFRELLGERLKRRVLEDNLVGLHLQQLRIGRVVFHNLVVRIVEYQELVRPRAPPVSERRGGGSIRSLLRDRPVGEFGFFRALTRSILVRSAEPKECHVRNEYLKRKQIYPLALMLTCQGCGRRSTQQYLHR